MLLVRRRGLRRDRRRPQRVDERTTLFRPLARFGVQPPAEVRADSQPQQPLGNEVALEHAVGDAHAADLGGSGTNALVSCW